MVRLALALVVPALALGCASGDSGDSGVGSAPVVAPVSSPATPATPAATTPAPAASAPAPTRSQPRKQTRALFFGDSYIIGGAYTGPQNSMAAIAARRLGWQAEIRGAGGTGFVSGNPEYGLPSFLGQIQQGALDVGAVNWLVIEGGGNDRFDAPSVIKRHAIRVLNAAAERHPEATLVLVGTMDPTVDDFSDTDGVIGALRRAAARVGVPYINAQHWLEGRQDLVGPDYDHPTPAGHRLCGRKLANALRALG
jgi:lysophospholipase L1-like esterase